MDTLQDEKTELKRKLISIAVLAEAAFIDAEDIQLVAKMDSTEATAVELNGIIIALKKIIAEQVNSPTSNR